MLLIEEDFHDGKTAVHIDHAHMHIVLSDDNSNQQQTA